MSATVDPGDSALDDDRVARLFWYHTSTQPNWPRRDFDPAAFLTSETRRLMGGGERVAEWVARQSAKALHVGTYEVAVHNMLRRSRDQADQGSQFYLYRVRLKPSVVVGEGWLVDPGNFVGGMVLDEVCLPGVGVARYLNYHEDPGGLSLALGMDAIASVQRIAVPLSDTGDDSWVRDAEGVASSYVEVGDGVRVGDRWWQGVQRAGVCDALVGPVGAEPLASARGALMTRAILRICNLFGCIIACCSRLPP
ncbi:hypothetical protein [Streptomyces sp. NPDC058751]|uniref:hypothetical protein n=1 Tax=Streptomyces sp. NPDC058751 TaxID=3346623 RepID=UPI0036B2F15C